MSTLTPLGSLSVGAILPTQATFLAGILPDLQGRLAGALSLSGSVSIEMPSITARLNAAAAAVAQIEAEIAISGPVIDVTVQLMADMVAEFEAQIAFILALQLALGSAGIYAYLYNGTAADFPALMASQGLADAQPSDQVNAIVLATRVPAAWAALGRFLRTSA
jgi:hypothetical protein